MGFPTKKGGKKKVLIKRVGKDSSMGKIVKKVLKSKGNQPHEGKSERAIKKAQSEFSNDDLDSIISDNADYLNDQGDMVAMPRANEGSLEVRRKQILRLLLRGVPKPTIQGYLKISQATLYRDLEVLNNSLRDEVQSIDMPLFVGMTLSFFDEIRNISLRMATDTNQKDDRLKLMALKTSLDAESEKHKYLTLTGLYGVAEKGQLLYRDVVKSESDESSTDDSADFTKFINLYYQAQTAE